MKNKKQSFYFTMFTVLMFGIVIILSACGVSMK
jgi:hypothetical protein